MKLKYLHLSLIALCVVAFGSTGCSEHDHNHDAAEHHQEGEEGEEHHHHEGVIEFSEEQAKSAGVKTMIVEAAPFSSVIKVTGEIISPLGDDRTIAATAAGIVTFSGIKLTPGIQVSAGQTLFSISAKNIAQVDNNAPLRAALSAAKMKLDRATTLIADKLITQREYDDALAEYNAAKAALSTPDVKVSATGTSASSPISGYIADCLVSPGQYVEVGQPLAIVSTNRRLQLRADVPAKYFADATNIVSANFTLPHHKDAAVSLQNLNGRVVSFGKGSTSKGVYFPIIFEFDNPGGLMPGATVETYLLGVARENVITIPRAAITEEEGAYFVYLNEEPGHYHKQEVRIGKSDGQRVEILSGLKEGDIVVSEGAYHLRLAANSGKAPEGHSHNH